MVRAVRESAGPDLATRAEGIERALTVGRDRLDAESVRLARAAIDRTGERLRLGADYTIVALVGATGSGKSTLFNALAGMELAETGVRRPTTGRAMACVWGDHSANGLLDWLGVAPKYRTVRESVLDADREAELHGLVLLDMPDHDSTHHAHRLEVDRLVEMVDLLVWVVDPQKYADEVLHHGYLTEMRNHDGGMIVVLNQIDKLGPREAETCRTDMRRLLDSDGLESVRLMVTSASTGRGVEDLRRLLAEVVDVQGAVSARAAADLDQVARRLLDDVAATEPEPKELRGADELVGALAKAAGVPVVLDAVEVDYARQAEAAMGWPFWQWWRRLRPDPLSRLGLEGGRDLHEVGRGGLRRATPSQQDRVELSAREVIAAVTDSLPRPWADSVREVANRPDADLATALDVAIGGVDLGFRRPGWWQAVRVAQLICAAMTVVGLLWLVLIGIMSFLQLDVTTPRAMGLPVPALLFVLGLLLGGALTLGARMLAKTGAQRRRMTVAAQMREAVQDVAWTHVVAPVADVLVDHKTVRESLLSAL